jgi:hypothetical protein
MHRAGLIFCCDFSNIGEQLFAGVVDTGDKHSFANISASFRKNFKRPDFFWKMPDFFSKRLKLDQIGKSGTFYKNARLFPENARLFRLKLRSAYPACRGEGGVNRRPVTETGKRYSH